MDSDDDVDSDQLVVNKELSLFGGQTATSLPLPPAGTTGYSGQALLWLRACMCVREGERERGRESLREME